MLSRISRDFCSKNKNYERTIALDLFTGVKIGIIYLAGFVALALQSDLGTAPILLQFTAALVSYLVFRGIILPVFLT